MVLQPAPLALRRLMVWFWIQFQMVSMALGPPLRQKLKQSQLTSMALRCLTWQKIEQPHLASMELWPLQLASMELWPLQLALRPLLWHCLLQQLAAMSVIIIQQPHLASMQQLAAMVLRQTIQSPSHRKSHLLALLLVRSLQPAPPMALRRLLWHQLLQLQLAPVALPLASISLWPLLGQNVLQQQLWPLLSRQKKPQQPQLTPMALRPLACQSKSLLQQQLVSMAMRFLLRWHWQQPHVWIARQHQARRKRFVKKRRLTQMAEKQTPWVSTL
jgi:hypothetical protein